MKNIETKKRKAYKKVCGHAVFGSTFLTALFHFVCCGVPALIALVSAAFGLSSIPALNFLSATQRTYLLIVGAILLGISFILYYKEKKCCDDPKILFWKKVILFSALGFFLIGLIFHIISLVTLEAPACH